MDIVGGIEMTKAEELAAYIIAMVTRYHTDDSVEPVKGYAELIRSIAQHINYFHSKAD